LSLTGRGRKSIAGIKGTPLLPLIYGKHLRNFSVGIWLNDSLETNRKYDLGTVRMTKGGEAATNNEIDKAIQNWLKGAQDRQGGRDYGRSKRQQKRCLNDSEEEDRRLETNEGSD